MAGPRAFISFDFDGDKDSKELFAGQAKNSKTPFDIQDWSSKYSLLQSQWEEEIKGKISKCHMLIVLVGTKMHSATGVVKEIGFAKDQDVPIFGVYVGSASTSTTLPDGLARSRVVAWEWDKIATKVDEMMKERKNDERRKE